MSNEDHQLQLDPYRWLCEVLERPEVYSEYTADQLWQDEHISQRMLEYHLNEETELASRPHDFIDRSAKWIGDRFSVGAETDIIDYGCGPGLYTTRLAGLGARVTGVDFSQRSIRYASKESVRQGLDVNYVLDDYLRWESDVQADVILLIFCDLCPLSPERRRMLFDKFRRHLKPGGSVLLDVCSLSLFESKIEETVCARRLLHGFFSKDDYIGFLATFKYPTEKVLLDKYTIVEDGGIRRFYNWLQCYSSETLACELSEYGFAINEVFQNVAGDPYTDDSPTMAVVAQPT